MSSRIPKEEWYMEIARVISMRSTCIRAHAGCIVVRNDAVVSQGYSGSPRGEPNCCDLGVCNRDELMIPPGERYELCESIHAEMNAIINAARTGVSIIDSDVYIYFERLDGQKTRHGSPCKMCLRAIKNAGIKNYIFKEVV
jgi:dCMP deaminase